MSNTHTAALIKWARELHSLEDDVKIDEDTDLVEAGLIDSLGFVGLMVMLEEMGASRLDELMAQPENFRSIRSVVDHCFN